MSRTGLRVGEALALQWEDLDFTGFKIRVRRTLSPGRPGTPEGRIGTPKTKRGRRDVDMSLSLRDVLQHRERERRIESLEQGYGQLPWVFVTKGGTLYDRNNTERRFKQLMKAAGLPLH